MYKRMYVLSITELMLTRGNYVSYLGEPMMVCSVNDKHVTFDDEIRKCVDLDKIYGILLTHRILMSNCGFNETDMDDLGICVYMKLSRDLILSLNNGTIWIGEHDTGNKYLHQLQNLVLSLSGKVLPVKPLN